MPINKNALLRQQVIDRCLSSGQRFTTAMLLDECNKALRDIGEKPVSSTNTIYPLFKVDSYMQITNPT